MDTSILPSRWGGFAFYFLGSRATAYAKHPDDKAWLFDADTMKPRINNPAWVRAIQDVIDALPSEPADQLNADPNTPGSANSLAEPVRCAPGGAMSDRTRRPTTLPLSAMSAASTSCPARMMSTTPRPVPGTSSPVGPNYAPNMAYIGWGVYVMARVDS